MTSPRAMTGSSLKSMMMNENDDQLPAYEFIAREQRSQGYRAAVEEILEYLNERNVRAREHIDDDWDAGYCAGMRVCIEQIMLRFQDR